MAGLAPAPFAGMIMADFGANVIRIDRPNGNSADLLTRRKRSLALDMKNAEAIALFKKLIAKVDVVLDPFRPGVMEKLGIGPKDLLAINPRLIFARLSGFGQTGSLAAGHDINYLAISGVLEMLGRQGETPAFPMNIAADFAGGGLMCVMGVLMALLERVRSGQGQVIDANLTSGSAYLATFPMLMRENGLVWSNERGTNMLDGGAHFYEVYKTKDDLYMAVGAIEPQFYAALLHGLGLKQQDLPDQHDQSQWPAMKQRFQAIFSCKTQLEWTQVFDGTDACCTPVLSTQQAIPGSEQEALQQKDHWPRQAVLPQPTPALDRTPAHPAPYRENAGTFLSPGSHSVDVLSELGLHGQTIAALIKTGVVHDAQSSHL
ncbi:CoA-transferase family III [Hesseltinella vesiculosa]|uniref:CoA-transferase family III n=1 Tax=Hesseltinella vesiculosa TaxID=101127 RepID=A0A1X2GAQ5_9FUNG|nr:CoA-transferase family III [Hesseltinella vesiculosa]